MELKDNKLIVGWGLAGSVLAWQFYLKGVGFQVNDSGVNWSTRTAAGLVNPIVFKRITKSWNADILMPYAEEFYSKIEQILGVQLLSRKPIFRVFASTAEENDWSSKQGDDRFNHYLSAQPLPENPSPNHFKFPFGLGCVKTFGSLNTNLFLDASKIFFERHGIKFINERFDYSQLAANSAYFFCEGVEIKNNPFFNYLPLKPTHGETLDIESNELNFEATINKNMFLTQVEGNRYKIGATYNWELDQPDITEAARTELVEKLAEFANFNYTILSQNAGIRPTVIDRKPLLGIHPTVKNAIVFNGLGTKGVMIAPYYAAQLIGHVYAAVKLESEVDILRFA